MSTTAPPRRWNDAAIAALENTLDCPRCGTTLDGRHCGRCRADFTGPIGGELWDASVAAVAALRARQAVLDRVPTTWEPVTANAEASAPAPAPVVIPAPEPPRSSATVQSVLAVAGAGLVAIAAIVFTFLNPDVTDPLARGLIVGAVTLVFFAGAAVLMRRDLRFSAEAVGALAVIFLALDVRAVAVAVPGAEWMLAAAATLIGACGLVALALVLRVRVWLWSGLLAAAIVPAMIGYAFEAPILGHLATAVAAFALIALTSPLGARLGETLRTERATLTVLQLLAVILVLTQPIVVGGLGPERFVADVCGLLAASAILSAFSTRHLAGRLWSFLTGAFGTAAVLTLPLAVGEPAGAWWMLVLPAAAVTGAIVTAILAPMPRSVERGYLAGGAITVVGITAVPPTLAALAAGAIAVLSPRPVDFADGVFTVYVACGLASLAAGLMAFALLRKTPWVGHLGVWYAGLALLTVLAIPSIDLGVRVAIGLVAATVVSLAVVRIPLLSRRAITVPLVATAHVLVLFAIILSWKDTELAVWAGPAVVAAIAVLSVGVRAGARFLHTGIAYAYALIVFASALDLAGVAVVPLVCLTTSLGALIAIAATFTRWVRVRDWYAVLVVTSVPFLLGVGQVVFERSGWTALSTSLIFALALTLVSTRRAGLVRPLRIAAASILVPSLAVVVVCLGAQLLVGSGSPVVLPVIAAIVAIVLPAGPLVVSSLAARIGEKDAGAVRGAIEATALLTAAIAVGLALWRDAAGLGTTLLVLAILGVAGAATAMWGDRRYGWWLAGAGFTGALWCTWGLTGVELVEAYLLPPTVGAAIVAVVVTARGASARALYASGLGVAIVPLVVAAAVSGPAARAYGLVAAAWVLALLGTMLRGRLAELRGITFGAAIVAGAAGAVQGVRFGLGVDANPLVLPLILVCAGLAVLGAAPAFIAARGLGTRSRWLTAPGFAYIAVGTWFAIERDWFAIWSMWTLLLALLIVLVVAAWRAVRGGTSLPPVWFLFGLAFVTAVVAWSPRDLRVEWFSLPLGVALLAAGTIGLRASSREAAARGIRSLSAWPGESAGSWALLGPGLVVLFSASVAATFTDPQTWRAILVIVLALVSILIGASRRLAAPFILGIIVLPVENVIAFLVQIGRGIEAMPWWITLAVVGAVLLIIAVTYERRAGTGIAARLRDLG